VIAQKFDQGVRPAASGVGKRRSAAPDPTADRLPPICPIDGS
jgi:hypothetical protein